MVDARPSAADVEQQRSVMARTVGNLKVGIPGHLLHPPLAAVGFSIGRERGCQQINGAGDPKAEHLAAGDEMRQQLSRKERELSRQRNKVGALADRLHGRRCASRVRFSTTLGGAARLSLLFFKNGPNRIPVGPWTMTPLLIASVPSSASSHLQLCICTKAARAASDHGH